MHENVSTANALRLNPDSIRRANNVSHFDAGDSLAREARRVYEKGLATMEPRPEWTQEQADYAARRTEEWRSLVEKAYNDLLNRRASWVPVNVAGPANYPAARMQKRADAEIKAGAEWSGKMRRFLDNTCAALDALVPVGAQIEKYKRGCSDPISGDDPAALEKLTARLEYLQKSQEDMKAINAYYRKHKTTKGFPGISDETAAKIDHSTANGHSYERTQPYQPWALSINSGNIARIKERITQVQRTRERAEAVQASAPETFDGFRIEQDAAANRIRIYFDGKPDEQTRALLKSRGFKWSPNAGAWQRQLNGNGLYAARWVAKALAPEGPIPAGKPVHESKAEEVTLAEFAARFSQ